MERNHQGTEQERDRLTDEDKGKHRDSRHKRAEIMRHR